MAKKQATDEEVALSQFNWEDDDENTFFGVQTDTKENVQQVVEDVLEDDDDDELDQKAQTKKPAAVKPADTSLEDDDEDDDEKGDKSEPTFFDAGDADEDEDKDELTDDQFKKIASFQIERFKHVEIDENEVITPEKLDELWEKEIDLTVKNEMDKLKALGDDIFKRQIAYMQNGGTAESFIKGYKEVSSIPEFDIAKEEDQDAVIKYYMRNIEENDEKEIDDFFEYLTESGKKEVYATRYNKKIVEYKKEKNNALEETQRKEKELRESEKLAFIEELESVVKDEKAVGFKIPKAIAETLPDYYAEPTVKLTSGKFITEFQNDLGKLFADKAKLAILGFLMKNNWDTSIFEKKAATDISRKVKTSLETKAKVLPASQSSPRKRSLSDFFTD